MEFRMNTTDGWEMGIWSYDDICPRTSISELSHQHINHSEPISRSYKASIDTKPKKKITFIVMHTVCTRKKVHLKEGIAAHKPVTYF